MFFRLHNTILATNYFVTDITIQASPAICAASDGNSVSCNLEALATYMYFHCNKSVSRCAISFFAPRKETTPSFSFIHLELNYIHIGVQATLYMKYQMQYNDTTECHASSVLLLTLQNTQNKCIQLHN